MCDRSKICPLLENPDLYIPDTIPDLNKDEEAKEYWLDCFNILVKKFSNFAKLSQINDLTSDQRAIKFQDDYLERINNLRNSNPLVGGRLTIRSLLELNESCLRNNGFLDPWREQKHIENEASIKRLRDRLNELDELKCNNKKWEELVKGLLAGNMFDWGASAVTEILQNDKTFGLQEALTKIQQRPWLVDGLDNWLKRVLHENQIPHKCAVIFVDNSGIDIVLGVLPFARELLQRKTKVILCANSEPSLNDITYDELKMVIEKCCDECKILENALKTNELQIYPNGQTGPCLDFRNLNPDLCDAMLVNGADLLIIEGMGRALHTNLHAKFKCETLKLAIVKNKWLANRLGGDTFSVICKYETV